MTEKELKETSANELEEARKLLKGEYQSRIAACSKEIAEVLKKHNCVLNVTQPQITITPSDG